MTTSHWPEGPLYGDHGEPVWERCEQCGTEYVAGHICRTHKLCGTCHNNVPISAPAHEVQPVDDGAEPDDPAEWRDIADEAEYADEHAGWSACLSPFDPRTGETL